MTSSRSSRRGESTGPTFDCLTVVLVLIRGNNSSCRVERWREYRAAIEEDYARRLAKLARQPLGRDETGYVVPAMCLLSVSLHELMPVTM